MEHPENNALKNINKALKQKLHCQLVNASGKVLATTNRSNAAKSKNNLELKNNPSVLSNGNGNVNSNGNGNVNGNGNANSNKSGGGKRRKGGNLGLTSLVMPAGVNPFLTTLGLAALSGTSKGRSLIQDVNPMGKRKSKSSVSKSKGRKRSVRKGRKRSVRKGGNMMSLLFPRGLSASLTAAGLAGLAKSGNIGKSSLSKSVKKRKVVRRKVQSGGKLTRKKSAKKSPVKRKTSVKKLPVKRKTSVKKRPVKRKTSVKKLPVKRKTSVKKLPVKRKTSVKKSSVKRKTKRGGSQHMMSNMMSDENIMGNSKRGGSSCGSSYQNNIVSSKRGGSQHMMHNKNSMGHNYSNKNSHGGGTKKKKVKISLQKYKGGGSDWIGTQYARGSSIAGDMTSCGPAACMQKAFTSQPLVPNSQLATWIAPQLTGTTGSMCGGMSKMIKKKPKTSKTSLKKKSKASKTPLKKKPKTSLKKKPKKSKRKTTRK